MDDAPGLPLASVDASQMQPKHQFWRVHGVPPELSKQELVEALRSHPSLRRPEIIILDDDNNDNNDDNDDDGCTTDTSSWVLTLASDHLDTGGNMVATIRVPAVWKLFSSFNHDFHLAIDVPASSSEINTVQAGTKRKRDSPSLSISLAIDRHFQGITTVFAPTEDEHKIDIFAVSGLGTHAFGSFVNEEDGHMWLCDRLPQDLPQARVMIYGYGEGPHSIDPEDHMCALQTALIQLLQSKKQRPLILIGHSVGGLFIKEAVIRIANSRPELMVLIRGILLFSVPNEGIDAEFLGSTISDRPVRSLIDCMNVLSLLPLRLQRQNFALVMSQSSIETFCFCESRMYHMPMQAKEPLRALGRDTDTLTSSRESTTEICEPISPPKRLVSWKSATSCLPTGASPDHTLSVDRSHWDIIKFFRNDPEYEKPAGALKFIAMQPVKSIPLQIGVDRQSLNQDQLRSLCDSLRFDQMETQQRAAHNSRDFKLNTSAWVLKKSEYIQWRDPKKFDEHHGLLWMKGKPGAGKSTFMRSLLVSVTKATKNHIFLSFFFSALGNELERSALGMYRSLLLQLFERLPYLQSVLHSVNLATQNIADHVWTVELLKALFKNAVRKINKSNVTCFIDTLGDSDEVQIQDMMSFFLSLGHMAASEKIFFRVLFSSGHYEHAVPDIHSLTLEEQDGHREEIYKYFSSQLKIGGTIGEQIRAEFREKSSNVFLWTALVVYFLNKEYEAGRVYTLRQVLRDLPDDLHQLYCKLLTCDSSNRSELLLCIQLILFAKQPLGPEEFYFAILSGTMPEAVTVSVPEATAVISERFVPDCSKGLAKVTNSGQPVVRFIHESVTEFFLKGYGVREIWPEYQQDFEGRSHEKLKLCCYNHMTLNTSQQLRVGTSVNMIRRMEMSHSFPFMKYAIQNLFYHAERAQDCGIDQELFLRSFPVGNWIDINNVFEQDEARLYTKNAPLLYILAEKDLPGLIRCQSCVLSYLRANDERYGTPLFAALAKKSDKALGAFLKAEVESASWGKARRWLLSNMNLQRGETLAAIGSEFKFLQQRGVVSYLTEPANRSLFNLLIILGKTEVRETALIEAAKNGNEELVEWLLNTNTELSNDEAKTALLCAAMDGHDAVVDLLLSVPGISIDMGDLNDRTPLSWSAGNGHEEVTKLLLNRGADVNAQGNTSQTPLGWAAMNGHVAIVELLLDASANIYLEDHTGLTPLRWAARNGHQDIVKMLSYLPELNISLKDKIGCAIVLVGGDYDYKPVVSLLLDQQTDVNSVAETGETPLIWAVKNGHKIALRMLLAAPEIDINVQDKDGRTSISWAAGDGDEAIAKLLLDRKVNMNIADNSGYTPLIWAVKNIRIKMVRLLLDHSGALPDLKDSVGRSPLSWASEGCEEIMELLLDTSDVDLNSKDDHGRSPLSYAAERGDENIVRRLLTAPGVELCSVDTSGWTPLFWACARWPVAQLLIKREEFDLDLRDCWGRTLLSWAAGVGAVDLAQLLLRKGVCVNSRDGSGRTPLSWAAGGFNSGLVRPPFSTTGLIHPSEEQSSQGTRGVSPQAIATHEVSAPPVTDDFSQSQKERQLQLTLLERQNKERQRLLFSTSSPRIIPQALQDHQMNSMFPEQNKRLAEARRLAGSREPLISNLSRDLANNDEVHLAQSTWPWGPMANVVETAPGNSIRMVNLLLSDGAADPDCRDNDGRSPLSYAAEQGRYTEASALLATKQVDLDFKDKTGQTPLCYARNSRPTQMVQVLSVENATVLAHAGT